MHCHMEYHNAIGMTLVLKDGDVSEMSVAPPNFPRCGNFDWDDEEFVKLVGDLNRTSE